MSPPEMLHRAAESVKRHSARMIDGETRFGAHDGPLPALPGLSRAARAADDRMLRDWRETAEEARAGRYRLLGQEWPGITHAGKWRLDPVTGEDWPATPYCFDIGFRHEQTLGDVKYVAELNRLQFLQPIAALAAATGDEALARFCAAEIESWIDANPPFAGVNWLSGIELALRMASLFIVAGFIGDGAFTGPQRRKLRGTLNAHGFWLARYPSRFSSANNHLIAEAAGLFLLGALAGDLSQAQAWKAYGFGTLVDQAFRQIHEDGVGAEQSPTYTAFTLEWFLLCLYAGEQTGNPFPEDVRRRLALACEHLCWITDERGAQPRIGDDDEGCVIFSRMGGETAYVSSVAGCLAAALQRPELAPPGSGPCLRELLFGRAGPPARPLQGLRCFPKGGYTVARENKGGKQALLVFDHGPLGYLSIAAHGHADALAIWLHIDGQPVLVDAGTYLYHSAGKRRDAFRGTGAHNTLGLNNEDQSIISGPFNWSRKANSRLIELCETGGGWRVEAEHDGYERRFGLIHRRAVRPGDALSYTVHDRLTGRAKRPGLQASLRYLVSPGLEVRALPEGGVAIAQDGKDLARLSFIWDGAAGGQPAGCRLEPASVSDRFGRVVEAVAITCRVPAEALLRSPILTQIVFPQDGAC
jgi:hypothetical protein